MVKRTSVWTIAMPDDALTLRERLADRYIVEGELAHGGTAVVYRAVDLSDGRPVAIKVVRSDVVGSHGAERFLREIRVAAGLRHPHILSVDDSGQAGGELYCVMPLVQGESLRGRLEREHQLPAAAAARIARQVAEALSYAHLRGIVHRDIKPENILLEGDHALVADFGVARAVRESAGFVTTTGVAVGTPAYMSPEQASADRTVDGRSDIYGLGCVLYEMLAGTPPFTGRSLRAVIAGHVAGPVPRLPAYVKAPRSLHAALARALAKDPDDRFPDARDFAVALAVASQEAAGATEASADASRSSGAPAR